MTVPAADSLLLTVAAAKQQAESIKICRIIKIKPQPDYIIRYNRQS